MIPSKYFKNSLPMVVLLLVAMLVAGCEFVRFRSEPDGAQISVNGKLLGMTPCDVRVDTLQGEYTFVAKKDGFKDSQRFISASPLALSELPGTLFFKLEPLSRGAISAHSQPAKVPPTPQHLPATQPGTSVGTRWAVVIGVSDYRDTRIPSLRYATKDAQTFHAWLLSPDGGKYAQGGYVC